MDTSQLKKKILIIEDKEKQYKKYKNWVENNLNETEVMPIETKWQELKGAIQTYFMVNVSDVEKKNAKDIIDQELNQEIFGLILDYELEKNKPTTCNAQLFYENFMSSKNIQHLLVISGIGGTKPKDWVESLKKENINLSADFIRIPKSDGQNFSDEVQKQIKEIFSSKKEDNIPLKI